MPLKKFFVPWYAAAESSKGFFNPSVGLCNSKPFPFIPAKETFSGAEPGSKPSASPRIELPSPPLYDIAPISPTVPSFTPGILFNALIIQFIALIAILAPAIKAFPIAVATLAAPSATAANAPRTALARVANAFLTAQTAIRNVFAIASATVITAFQIPIKTLIIREPKNINKLMMNSMTLYTVSPMYTNILMMVAATSTKEIPNSLKAAAIAITIAMIKSICQLAIAHAAATAKPAMTPTVAKISKAMITKLACSVTQSQPATKRLKSHRAIWPIANIAVSKPAMKFCPAVLLINSCHAWIKG